METDFTLLVSSVGRRAQLLHCFRRAAKQLNVRLRVLGADAAPEFSPASHLVDECFRVPRCSDPHFIKKMLELCTAETIDLLVPTIDPELPIYAEHVKEFETGGTRVMISNASTVDIAFDKQRTNQWFVAHNIPTVRQAPIEKVLSNLSDWRFPVIVKPRYGSASVGVRVVNDAETLELLTSEPSLLVESMAAGKEHTINVYVDSFGRCACAVPHQRLETRGGEVSKAVTVKNGRLMELAKKVAEALPGARGPLNLQGFVDDNNHVQFTEINARFGGGFPLAAEAGANFCTWILEDSLGRESTAHFSNWRDHLLMLRFDNAVFVHDTIT